MIGRTISHYRIVAKLGAGGMGVVYRAEDTRLRRPVALKFLQPSLADEAFRKRFVREAQAASAIEHPNICAVHEIGEAPDGGLFIVMPCYEGQTLEARLGQGALDIPEALEIAIQAGTGLARAHESGVVHRDLKPANLFLTADGVVKILDFGLARLEDRTQMTRTGTVAGTAAYMAPEQYRGAAVDAGADIWALGVVLYEMVTGAPAFRGEHAQALMYAVLNDDPPPMLARCPEAPVQLQALLARAMAKAPSDRPRSAAEVVAQLQEVLASLRRRAAAGAEGGSETAEAASIAVLPFVNMSPDPDNQYFGDGLAEELLNALAQIPGLRVAARTSAFRFRDAETDIREIGRQLNVGAVLEGSVRRAGDRLRVMAQLIAVKDGYHLWSERFDRKLDDIFAVQDEIAHAIVRKLEVELTGPRDQVLVARATENLDAYNAFLEARFHLYKLTPEGWARSLELFHEAIRLDPAYAAPHGMLAMLYGSQAWWGGAAPTEAMAAARSAAERALALDPDCTSALAALGICVWTFDRDPLAAERIMRRALILEPGSAQTLVNLAMLLNGEGRYREAAVTARLALKADPLSSLTIAWTGAALSAAGESAESFATFRRGIELDPQHWQIRLHLGVACLRYERDEEALATLERARDLSGGASVVLATLAMCLHLLGRTDEADGLTERLHRNREHEYVPPSFFAWIAVARGEPDAALPHLEQALRERDIWIVTNPWFGDRISLRGPEVDRLLAAAGLGPTGAGGS
ncbi:MAG: protein kinase [Candidatus Krumholzibacteriia bacterium]